MNIQPTTRNKGECRWLHQPLSLLCPDLTAWFKIKIKEICQQAFPQLRRILNCCGFPLHPFGSVPQTINGEDWEQAITVFYQFQINKTVTEAEAEPVFGFIYSGDWNRYTPAQSSSSMSSSCTETFQACCRAASASLSHSSPEKWNPEWLSVPVERCSSAMAVTWRTKNRLDEYSLFNVGLRSKWWFEDVNYEGEWHNPIPFKECLLKLPPYFHTHTFSLPFL